MSIIARLFDANAGRYMPDQFSLHIPDGVSFAPLEPFMHGITFNTPELLPMPSVSPSDEDPSAVDIPKRTWTLIKTSAGWEVQCLSDHCTPISVAAETNKKWGTYFFHVCIEFSEQANRRSLRFANQ